MNEIFLVTAKAEQVVTFVTTERGSLYMSPFRWNNAKVSLEARLNDSYAQWTRCLDPKEAVDVLRGAGFAITGMNDLPQSCGEYVLVRHPDYSK